MTFVIDCSKWQGAINWPQLKSAGCVGAIVKVTDGASGVDAIARTHHDGARGAGIPAAPYHFSEDGNPAAEAAHFATTWGWGWDFRPWLDEELGSANAAFVRAFRSTFRSLTGYPLFGVYSSESLLAGPLAPGAWIDARSGIWAARYASSLGWTPPDPHQLLIWQYSSSATVPGVLGHVDESEFMNGWTPSADRTTSTTTVGATDVNLSDEIIAPNGPNAGKPLADVNDTLYFTNLYSGQSSTKLDSVLVQLAAISGALSAEEAATVAAVAGVDADLKTGITQLVQAIAAIVPGTPTDAQVQALVVPLANALVPLLPAGTTPAQFVAALATQMSMSK